MSRPAPVKRTTDRPAAPLGDGSAAHPPPTPSEAEARGAADDGHIVARIADAVHSPFDAAWRRHRRRSWGAVERALGAAIAAHGEARAALEGGGDGAAREPEARAEARYRVAVARGALAPLRAALEGVRFGASLASALEEAARRADSGAAALPDVVHAPVAPDALESRPGQGARTTVKRLVARAAPWIAWRRETRAVPVARLARAHLDRRVRALHRRAFAVAQRRRTRWLAHVERAWADWIRLALPPAGNRSLPVLPLALASERGVLDAARTLDGDLRALLAGIPHAGGGDHDAARLTEALAGSVAVAGTFVASPRAAKPTPLADGTAVAGWDEWAAQAALRLRLHEILVTARSGIDRARDDLVRGWSRVAADVEALLDRVEEALRAGSASVARMDRGDLGSHGSLEALRRQGARLRDALDEPARALGDGSAFVRALEREADRAVGALEALCQELPRGLPLHDVPERDAAPRRLPGEARVARVREAAVQAFDALRMERVRTAATLVADAVDRVRVEVDELIEVAAYGRKATLAELAGDGDADAANALDVLADALSRARDKADLARDALGAGLRQAVERVRDEIENGATRMIERLTADRLAAGYLSARSFLARQASRSAQRWRDGARRTGRRALVGARAAALRLRPLGAVLGIRPRPGHGDGEIGGTLASAEEFVRALPVVYRRLFAFDPLTDARLLAGREEALAEIERSWTLWREGGPGVVIVVAPPGAGITSFMNALQGRLARRDARCAHRVLERRYPDERRMAPRLARWLGLDDAGDFDEIARLAVAAPEETLANAAIIEGAEHLHLRAPGGDVLIARLGTLMARTEDRIFWVVSVAASAWQLIQARAPDFAADLKQLSLRALAADDLREAIMARHVRSGLPLRFAQPRAGRGALRTRAGRLGRSWRGDRKRQVVEDQYFERLARASHGSIRLALFHWLRSADFDAVEGSLLVRPLDAVDPPLDALSTTQSFALKAALDHGTLTVDEYCRVARVSPAEGAHTLRSLEDRHVVERVDAPSSNDQGEPDSSPARYRIAPLMVAAASAHLRSRNILH